MTTSNHCHKAWTDKGGHVTGAWSWSGWSSMDSLRVVA